MGKKSKGKSNKSRNENKSSVDNVVDLIEKQKAKKEEEILKDDNVQAKIEEYNQLILEMELERERIEKELKEKYELKELELKELIDSLENEKKDLEKERKNISKEKKEVIQKAMEDIKNDEKRIRQEEQVRFDIEWNDKKKKREIEFEDYLKSKRDEIEAELEKAYKLRLDAEKKKVQVMWDANEEVGKNFEELLQQFKVKSEELLNERKEYSKLITEVALDKADIEDEMEYVKQLREKYVSYSPEQVLRLEGKIFELEEMRRVDQEHIKELVERNTKLEKYSTTEDGRSLLVKVTELEKMLKDEREKSDELANMPSLMEIADLRAKKEELQELKLILDEEIQKRFNAESKISQYAMNSMELESARVSAAALESLNKQLQMKLKYISEEYKNTQESKFPGLLQIDEKVALQVYNEEKEYKGNLKDLVSYIRNYGAMRKEPLYYSEETIRCFLASLGASRLMILQGLSGTGKSSLPRLFSEALNIENSLVPVQPSWRDNRELLGYDNDFTNRFKETEFTKYLYEASAIPNRNKIWFIVLDEMNLARIEYYFADFLSILEKDKNDWIIPLVSSFKEIDDDQKPKYLNYDNAAANICVSENIWFLGTANNDDSTSLITDKVYDRAQILDMDRREESFVGTYVKQQSVSFLELNSLFSRAKSKKENQITKEDMNKIESIDMYLMSMNITFGNRIKKQIEDFVPIYVECGGTKEGAIDYLLTHKILRKLDERYESYLVNDLKQLKDEIINIYGESSFPQSLDKIKKLINKINPGDMNGY